MTTFRIDLMRKLLDFTLCKSYSGYFANNVRVFDECVLRKFTRIVLIQQHSVSIDFVLQLFSVGEKTVLNPLNPTFFSSSKIISTSSTESGKSSLTPPNFEELELPPVKKDFYSENDHLADRDDDEIDDYLDEHQVTLTGRFQPRPCMSFHDINLPEQILSIIKSKNFDKPTPIQAQSWPIALSGDDMVGLAQTGSGKTCAFVIPGLVHIINNKETPRDKICPIMLVLCPTRELSQQVSLVAEEFAAPLGFNTVCVYGGAPRHEQSQKLTDKQPEILVATPGRLIDFMESKQVTRNRYFLHTFISQFYFKRVLHCQMNFDLQLLNNRVVCSSWNRDVRK